MRWLIRAIVLLAMVIGGFVLAERLTLYAFDPRRLPPQVPGVEDRVIESATGKDMVIWLAEAEPGRPTILYLHGNAGGLEDRSFRFRNFVERGYGLVAPGYRGSSGSAGWPVEALILRDMRALYGDLVAGRLTGEPVRPILYGESIGAAVAIQVHATASVAPRAVVLEAPFTSIRDIAKDVQPELVLLTGFLMSPWRSIDHAPALTAPLLVLHGRNDNLVPIAQGRAIFEAAQSTDKTFVEVPNAGHIDVWKRAAQKKLYAFLNRF